MVEPSGQQVHNANHATNRTPQQTAKHQTDETTMSQPPEDRSPGHARVECLDQEQATDTTQYFIRYSLNSSIRARKSHLRRGSGRLMASGARVSGRRRSGRQAARQVRFKPVAQAIEVEQHSPADSSPKARASPSGSPRAGKGSSAGKQLVRVQQQLNRLGRKSRLHHLAGSAKPITRQLNQLGDQLGKIRLKSITSQLQQTFSTGATDSADLTTALPRLKSPSNASRRLLTSKGFRLLVRKSQRAAASCKSVAASGGNPIQRTFHIRHSAASARNQLTLAGPRSSGAESASNQPEDEDGWGSDFDESQSNGRDSDESQPQSLSEPGLAEDSPARGRYKFDQSGGRPTQALDDIIQDQGLSGHFKRLDLSAELHEAPQDSGDRAARTRVELRGGAQAQEELEPNDDDEDEEAELASLEARQGFRQVRDKLQLILDRRLASYEQQFEAATSSIDIRATNKCSRPLQQAAQPVHKSAEGELTAPPPAAPPGQVKVVVLSGPVNAKSTRSASTGGATNCDRFDCQSSCSEASSLSSQGLDSNHSGSQDSGHSTQHSGYSTSVHRRQLEVELSSQTASSAESSASPTNQLDSGASTFSDHEQEPADAGQKQSRNGSSDAESEEARERRYRFAQNRSIINSKLESMFKSRSTSAVSRVGLADSTPTQNSSPKSVQSCPAASPPAKATARPMSLALGSAAVAITTARAALNNQQPSVEAAIRVRLLEQQRQMSLKLKQKPRRRSAKRALNLISPADCSSPSPGTSCSSSVACHSSRSSACNASLDGSTAAGELHVINSSHQPAHQRTLADQQQQRHRHETPRDSLSKQLSMVCLRRLASSETGPQADSLESSPAVEPRPALSLRQLVKEVIDDCETPGKLSTLTRDVLNRSDSLSSEALSASPAGSQLVASTEPKSAAKSQQADANSASLASQSAQLIKPIGILPNQQFSTPLFKQRHFINQLQQTPISAYYPTGDLSSTTMTSDQSVATISSLGTIDGLEFAPIQGLDQSAEEPQLQSTPTSCLKQQKSSSSSGIGTYWKNLRQFSRFKMTKANMAYLDNTNNFFTDDDS